MSDKQGALGDCGEDVRLVRELYLRACHLGLRHGLHFGLFVAVSRSPISAVEIGESTQSSGPSRRLTHPCLLAFISQTVEPGIVITNMHLSALE